MVIPVIDLFAGPGGLSEGFERYRKAGKKAFRCVLSIEKEEFAHQTLLLRAFYRQFETPPKEYFAAAEAFAGATATVMAYRGAATRVVELNGRTVIPGCTSISAPSIRQWKRPPQRGHETICELICRFPASFLA